MREAALALQELKDSAVQQGAQLGQFRGEFHTLKQLHRRDDGVESVYDVVLKYWDDRGSCEPGNAILGLGIIGGRLQSDGDSVPGVRRGESPALRKEARIHAGESGIVRIVYERKSVL